MGCGEGSAWERWLVQPRFFLVDLEAPVQPRVPLYGRNALGWCLLPEKELGVTKEATGARLCVAVTAP